MFGPRKIWQPGPEWKNGVNETGSPGDEGKKLKK
jgi:hypothetical protein